MKPLTNEEVSQSVKDMIYEYFNKIVDAGDYTKHISTYVNMLSHLSTYNPSAALLVDTLLSRASILNPHFKFRNS